MEKKSSDSALNSPGASLDFLSRRSSALGLREPAPEPDVLQSLLQAACSVPDHGSLRPYRFVVVGSEARERFGTALAEAAQEHDPALSDFHFAKIKQKAFFGPCLIALISSPKLGAKVPVWEQEASAACTGFALVLAAEALGFGAVWKSAPVHRGTSITRTLGLTESEHFLGWVNLGTNSREVRAREAPDLSRLVTHL